VTFEPEVDIDIKARTTTAGDVQQFVYPHAELFVTLRPLRRPPQSCEG
jgi:hypothetical protein